MWPFNRKITQKPERKRNSLGTADVTALMEEMAAKKFDDLLEQSYHNLEPQFKAVDQNNKVIPRIARPAKVAGIGTFAMDAPSNGNVLSMKPSLPVQQTINPFQLYWYARQTFIGYQACAMLAQQWFISKVCGTPPRDAIRHGYELATEDDEKIDSKVMAYIKRRDKQFGIKDQCVRFVKFNRIYGIRIALPIIDTDDPNYYLLPFDIDKVKPGSYRGISQIDPYWITPELDFEAAANPADIHFYEPTWWRVNGKRIHRTHLVIIRGDEVADILKPTYYYGGLSVPQKIAERIYAAERTANEGPELAMTKRTTFMNVDITQAVANFQEFIQKMAFYAQTRDNYGVKIGGIEDKWTQFDTSLSDFDDMTMMQYTLACAAADCPTAKIMGTSPKGGLGSEGTYDADSYHEFLETLQMNDMEPLIERHHLLLVASEVRPKFPQVPKGWQPTIVWNSTETLGKKQQAEINEIESRTGNNLVNSGAIDGFDERERLIEDKASGYNGLGDREPEPMDLSAEEDITGNIKSDKTQHGESE